MYLMKLVDMPLEKRIDEFAKIINFHKVAFMKNKKNVNGFIAIYPEWALGFAYVDDLKKAIAQKFKQEVVEDKKEKP